MNRVLPSLGVLFLLAGCSAAKPTPAQVLSGTSAELASVRSGIIELRVTVAPDEPAAHPIGGFALLGSFAWRDDVPLPVVDLLYTDLSRKRSFDHRVVSDGNRLFVRSDGRFYEVPLERIDPDGSLAETDGLFAGIHLEDWIGGARLAEGEGLDGRQVDRIIGRLREDPGLTQFASIVHRLPLAGSLPVLEALDPVLVAMGVESDRIEVISGSEDRQLRRLSIEVELQDDSSFARSRRWSDAASIRIDLGISESNRPIDVEAPQGALPIREMDGGWP